MSLLNLRAPVCSFLCDPPGSSKVSEICNQTCENNKNCALTPQILYTFVQGVVSNANLFLAGAGDIIREQARSLALRLAVFQQLPWFITFVLLIIILAYYGILGLSGIFLIAVAVVLLFIFIWLSFTQTEDILVSTTNQVINQINKDYQSARDKISEEISGELIRVISEGRMSVPCGCTCSDTGVPSGNCNFAVSYTGDLQSVLQRLQMSFMNEGGTFNLSNMTFSLPSQGVSGNFTTNSSQMTITFTIISPALDNQQCAQAQMFVQSFISGNSNILRIV